MAVNKYIFSLKNYPTKFNASANGNLIYDYNTYKELILEHFENSRNFPLRKVTHGSCDYYSVHIA
jgi:hypothetical protein